MKDSNVGFCTWHVCENTLVGDAVFAELFGFIPHQLAIGVTIEQVLEKIAPEDRERIAKEVHDAILYGELYQTRFTLLSPQGRPRWVSYLGRCLRDTEGLPSFFSGTITDLGIDGDQAKIGSAEVHCRTALCLAQKQRNELAARYLAKALSALGTSIEG